MAGALVREILKRVLGGGDVSRDEADRLAGDETPLEELLAGAGALRAAYFHSRVKLCSVVNARSGICAEDCSFCAQSARWKAGVKRFEWIGEEPVAEAAREAKRAGATMLGIVTSGARIENEEEFESILESVRRIGNESGIDICASLGALTAGRAESLGESGLRRYHHNLETSRNFFPRICTTHSFDERVMTVKAAQGAGLEVCSGGIFGLGEGWGDRIDLAYTLRELGVDSVPLNFLIPIPGTPLGSRPLLSPEEALRIIALFRFILPGSEIRVCGGREECLGDHQRRIFHAGASGTMVGDYLTRAGRSPTEDLEMISELGLEVAR